MLKLCKKLQFESLHCSLHAVLEKLTGKINTINVSSHEQKPLQVKPSGCRQEAEQQQDHKRCSESLSPAPNPPARQYGTKDTRG